MNDILIVAQKFDPHADAVVSMLSSRGESVVRIDTADILTDCELVVECRGAQLTGYISYASRSIALDAIKSCWWRRMDTPTLSESLTHAEKHFAKAETIQVMHGLWASLSCYTICRPSLVRAADKRPEQQIRASKFGFRVPRTLITSNPQAALDFFDACKGEVVFKGVTKPDQELVSIDFPSEIIEGAVFASVLMTKPVSREELLKYSDSIRQSLCVFQEYIPKQHELRVTVIGNRVFSARIHSQEFSETKHDWRNYDVPFRMTEDPMSQEIKQRCLDFVNSYGLNFSALDFIVTPEGEHVFVENNPAGQWLFVEDRVPSLKMREALCECLVAARDK